MELLSKGLGPPCRDQTRSANNARGRCKRKGIHFYLFPTHDTVASRILITASHSFKKKIEDCNKNRKHTAFSATITAIDTPQKTCIHHGGSWPFRSHCCSRYGHCNPSNNQQWSLPEHPTNCMHFELSRQRPLPIWIRRLFGSCHGTGRNLSQWHALRMSDGYVILLSRLKVAAVDGEHSAVDHQVSHSHFCILTLNISYSHSFLNRMDGSLVRQAL
jgi:hypothetical protein